MADTKFFTKQDSITLKEVISLTGSKILEEVDLNLKVEDIASLENATSKEISFFINNKYIESFKNSGAGFCFVYEKHAQLAPKTMIVLIHPNPYKAYAIIADKFYGSKIESNGIISSSASIDDTATIGKNCSIGNFVTIESGVTIGDNSIIDHNTVIKKNVKIGSGAHIHSNVTISHAIIGDNVVIHTGARIGQEGFGFASDHTGHLRVPQLGRVIIGNSVNIGANTTIDRGSAQDTIIEDMCQIDNLVQLGHNVKLGKACVVVAQVGIAGSTKLGNFVVLGGQVGVAGHLNIGHQVQVAAQSGIAQDVADKQIIGGSPAVPIRTWHRQNFALSKLVNKGKKDE